MERTRRGIYYGWWIVAATCASTLFNGLTYSYGLSVFYKRLIDHFGWTRASLAGAVSLSRLEAGLMGGVEGFLVDRFGPRWVVLIGMPLMALGFALLSRINSLLEFYIIFVLCLAVGQSLSHNIPFDTTIANWFIKKRGIAFGLLRSSTAVGGGGAIITAWFIAQYGWRMGFLAASIGTLILTIPVAAAMRSRPEDYGLLPDGDIREESALSKTTQEMGPEGSSHQTPVRTQEDIGMTVRQALKSWPFWAISLAYAIRLGTTGAVTLHAIPLVEDMGYSRVTAAGVLGTIGMVSLIGRLGGGALNDIIGTKPVAVGCIVSLAISFLILAQAQSLWHIYLFVAIYAPSYGASAATLPAIKGDYFGRRNYGSILGLSGILQTGGSMFGPVFAGHVYDITRSYRLAFLVFAGMLSISAALFMSLRRPRYSSKS